MSAVDKIEIRFICDDNLGKLARYLRAGGFDTVFKDRISNSELIKIALDEKRIILTRHRKLIERTLVRRYFLIEDNRWIDQLRAVKDRFKLEFHKENMFLRCLEDNALTQPALKDDIKTLVYPHIYERHTTFRKCPHCGRIFWPGTHITAMIGCLSEGGIEILE